MIIGMLLVEKVVWLWTCFDTNFAKFVIGQCSDYPSDVVVRGDTTQQPMESQHGQNCVKMVLGFEHFDLTLIVKRTLTV